MFVTQALAQDHATGTDHSAPPNAVPVMPTNAETVAHEGGHDAAPFPPMNPEYFASQLLWLAITFGVFYYVLSKIILPRLGEIIENRQARITTDLSAAERMRADADEAQAAYEQELASARENSHRIAIEARDAARTDADAQRKRIEAELDGRLESAQARIEDIKSKALADVDAIAEEATDAIMTELTGQQVPREDVSRAVRSVRA
ncbi:F0F1 ATP synthase subunit B [Aureimonas jatrophae]|uniref:ATP synthase subunit b n=1 Tax=Aureimonas jatrophae TaxID=1166073 RepID=A0A1H0GKV6_9HYPH|nr:F0F1 ATP synthase subunit B [Aureimonas jatrophae]SDO07585.1 F-type H+-transporting ATPase subunit b [Aureimonas jatrophae]